MMDILKNESNIYMQDDLNRRRKQNRMWTYSKPYFSHLESGDYDTAHFIGWLQELPNT